MIDQPLENNIPDENSIDPCLVSLQMQLDAANSKIAELEKYLQKVQADRINDIAKERKRWAREDLKALAIRDLEQRAKGIEDAIKETVSDLYRLPLRDVCDLYHYATVLRNQAKALEQGE